MTATVIAGLVELVSESEVVLTKEVGRFRGIDIETIVITGSIFEETIALPREASADDRVI